MQYSTIIGALFVGAAVASPLKEARQAYVPCSGL